MTILNGSAMPWMDIQHPKIGKGLYFGVQDPIQRYKRLNISSGAPGNPHADAY